MGGGRGMSWRGVWSLVEAKKLVVSVLLRMSNSWILLLALEKRKMVRRHDSYLTVIRFQQEINSIPNERPYDSTTTTPTTHRIA